MLLFSSVDKLLESLPSEQVVEQEHGDWVEPRRE